ncbi:hypothetical protein LGA02_003862 [Salmonella enterica]|nr:hypothetical protein [Salmonella enterica subsp. enterica serovar Newport]EBX2871892.1 hypothetical protein [Salmonella enterica subsp. enterica serovar Muenchen]ECK6698543.1 hypothetical protein [Salmonella enterica]EBV4819679.1 hypothetical protein [Salmonella enterica subsp. enterica serovar Newport]ECB2272623.1 hypothetical protein [Salmonella enterica subsp. enterica serovar Newport]
MLMDYLCHIGNTLFCAYQLPFSQEWDDQLNKLLNEGVLLFANKHTATFSIGEHTVEIWIANRWYSFGEVHRLDGEYPPSSLNCRPRFRTMRRLHAAVKDHAAREVKSCF